ncbi:MAG: hypothetical protein QXQ81_07785 [Candidatus Thorarchaeota archaeon]
MEGPLMISTAGVIFLAFRLWLVERKLVEELQFRRRYTSRFISYYTALATALALNCYVLNLVVMMSFPILLVTVGWDIRFYRRFSSRNYWHKNRTWLIVERLTLHPPVVILALLMIYLGAESYIRAPTLITIGLATLLLYVPFFLFDERWRSRYLWPQAIVVIALFTGSMLSMMIAQAFLWGVPLW